MADFRIDVKKANQIANEENKIVGKLISLESRISAVRSGLNLGSNTYQISQVIKEYSQNVKDEKNQLVDLRKCLEFAASTYEITEKKLSKDNPTKLAYEEVTGDIMNVVTSTVLGGIISNPALLPVAAASFIIDDLLRNEDTGNYKFTDGIQRWIDHTDNGLIHKFNFIASDEDDLGKYTHKTDLIKKFASKKGEENKNKGFWQDKVDKIKKFNDNHKYDKKVGYYENGKFVDVSGLEDDDESKKLFKDLTSLNKDVTLATIGTGVSGTLLKADCEGEWGIASGSAGVKLMSAEANMSAYAGIYSYTDDGKKIFTPGFGADVGVGVTVFSAEAQGQIGDEYFNLHGDASVEVLKAEAKAGVNVGLVDKNGKINPQVKVNANAEAILAKASASAGTTIAGTSVDVTGSVQVGVGAHLDVGYSDGKFTFDIGASLGIGASVKFDIDVSGTVGAVADTAKAVWKKIKFW